MNLLSIVSKVNDLFIIYRTEYACFHCIVHVDCCRCEVCVDSVFTRPTAACPECGLGLRRNQYRIQQFEDSEVEKEVDIRKRIVKE